jgi:hypothetical protein
MVGIHVAELSPVIPVAVTAETTAVRLVGSFAVYVAVPTLTIGPAVYATALAAIAGPAGGVKAPAMTVVIQPEPAAALRASFTETEPREPLMVPPITLLGLVPRAAVVGTVMDSAPPVTTIVAVVMPESAEAGVARASRSAPAAEAASRLRLMDSFALGSVY